MPAAVASNLQFPCRSRACGLRAFALIALWIALLAGFVAQTMAPPGAPTGTTQTETERSAPPAGHPS
jgi:hypothetical protein